MSRRGRLLAALLPLLACAGELEPIAPAPPEGPAPPADAALDASPDAALDASPDAALDASPDAAAPPADAGPDAGPDAAAPSADAAPTPLPVALGAVQYPSDRTHAPITPDLAERLRAVASRGSALQPDVFAKVGDSNTVNTNFLACFGGSAFDLAGHARLRATLDWFRGGSAGGVDPFRRVSLAATVGWSAGAALAGTPSPLARELDAARPRLATVMFGTNDIQSRDLLRYGQNLLDLADQSLARGVIPLFTAIPARADDPAADLWVPRYIAVMRAVAQSRGVPFIDLWRALATLPTRGLGSDGLHLNAFTVGGAARGCVFTPEGLRFGHNTRNLLTLEALDRVRAVLRGDAAPDPDAPRLPGAGTPADPFTIPALPFGDARDTAARGVRAIDRYPCRPAADESGPEFYYRLRVTVPTRVRALVVTRGSVDVDLHLLANGVTADRCVARDDTMLVTDLAPGDHTFVLDTFVGPDRAPRAGEYLFVLLRE